MFLLQRSLGGRDCPFIFTSPASRLLAEVGPGGDVFCGWDQEGQGVPCPGRAPITSPPCPAACTPSLCLCLQNVRVPLRSGGHCA